MAIQMISDLPVLQITEDTTAERLRGSFMEVSYLLSSANDGDKQNRYVSMAIPLGTLKNAMEKAVPSGGNVLFELKWLDYTADGLSAQGWVRLNRDEWIPADGFPDAYNHLVDDYSGTSDISSDQIGDVTVEYRLAPDGHKIIGLGPDTESKRASVYSDTGRFWYYVVDQTGRRFKLPLLSADPPVDAEAYMRCR